jgi:LacI family transcriptional regulator
LSTMRDVANRAGVSAKTVSRVMNNDRYVSDDVRARVLQAVTELDYVPNAMARSFRSGQDTAIGVAVPAIDAFFGTVIQAVEELARARGVAMFLTCLGDRAEDEQPALEALLSRNLVGLIVAPVAPDQSYLKPWRSRTTMMFVDRRPRRLISDSVVPDDNDGTRLAITHLVEHGHRRIAFAGDSVDVPTTHRRRSSYELTLFDLGIGLDPFLVSFGAHRRPVVPRLLALPDPPTAIFAASAECGIEVVRQLHAAGRQDVTVLSFGDFSLADSLSPAVSAIDSDPFALGAFAATRLFERVDNPDKHFRKQTVIPVSLVRRGCCETARPAVAWAVR